MKYTVITALVVSAIIVLVAYSSGDGGTDYNSPEWAESCKLVWQAADAGFEQNRKFAYVRECLDHRP